MTTLRHRNDLGFTMVEILAVLLLLGLLAIIAAPRFLNLTESARSRTIDAALTELNGREKVAWGQALLQSGGIPDDATIFTAVAPENLGSDFQWEAPPSREGASTLRFQGTTHGLWRTAATPTQAGKWIRFAGVYHDFTTATTSDFISQWGAWNSDGNGFFTTRWGAMLFTPNPISQGSYQITLNAALGEVREDRQANPDGGYGIFFNTTLVGGEVDSGYILQFDRTMGALVIRPWQNGSEQAAVLRFNDRALIPLATADPDWWTRDHAISIRVTEVAGQPGQRQMEILMNGEALPTTFEFAAATGETYTGLRSWGTFEQPSQFSSLAITAP